MTIEEKREQIEEFCGNCNRCEDCPLYEVVDGEVENCYTDTELFKANVERNYEIIFGKEKAENEEPKAPVIKDSGERREFDTGAVRDITEGKGRCDLLPLDVVASWLSLGQSARGIIDQIALFVESRDTKHLQNAVDLFSYSAFPLGVVTTEQRAANVFLEVSKHFEEGAKKYSEDNWKKGIPEKSYIDSAVRHYLKWLRGDQDEPHDRAFVWNILCLIWTVKHKGEIEENV